jgi:hypothetical protein
LTRLPLDPARELIRKILLSGVVIQTLDPERTLTKSSLNDVMAIVEILIICSRANEESERKSNRGKAKWGQRRKLAQEKGLPMTRQNCPSWCEVVDGKFKVVPWKVKIVKRIFALAIAGNGMARIASILNNEQVPQVSVKNPLRWHPEYIHSILTSRKVLGEYSSKRTKDVFPNLFPAIISAEDYHKVQAGIEGRRLNRTRVRTGAVHNLFAGLIFAPNGEKFIAKVKADYTRLCCYGYPQVHYDYVERLILGCIPDVQPEDNLPSVKAEIEALREEVVVLDERIGKLRTRLETAEDIEEIDRAIRSNKQRRAELEQRIGKLEQEEVVSVAGAMAELKHLRGALLDNSTAGRLKMRATIQQAIEKIVVIPHKVGHRVKAEVQAKFRGIKKVVRNPGEKRGREIRQQWSR